MEGKDSVKKTKEQIVEGISHDGRPPEDVRSLHDLSIYIPKDTPIDQFARAVDGLVREGVTP